MKITLKFIVIIAVFNFQTPLKAQDWKTPIIQGYGKIIHYDQAENTPDPSKEYKIIFHIKDGKERENVNEGLWKIARLINLMGNYQVPHKNLKIVAVISGTATPVVLTNKEHQEREQRNNPNLDLLSKLKQHKVKILVCGQALGKHKIDAIKDLNPFVEITTSSLIALPSYQMEGYVPMF
ncbi:DsrE family protein [Gelidibacter maritimus]|uniref:DsrE family protein n=1 Tax=Gelidibacter maritimus TaxID=2761487 RepID=A0A7W2M2A7_9FLAO|nr:DsrE family protein [Gelidibacter maritimus]MBA6151325.1 DsrE family protein [Gelidibacter maritimus]